MRVHGTPRVALAAGVVAAIGLAGSAAAQLRIVEWNVTNYESGRTNAFQTAFYGINGANGLTMAPDVVIAQELLSSTGVVNFRNLLNNAPNSPGDWDSAAFTNGPDTDSAFFYRTSRVELLAVVLVAPGGGAPEPPRDIRRYDIRPIGYAADETIIACYSSHMKAGTTGSDEARRWLEATYIRESAQSLPPGWNFLLAGDLNIQDSGENAYQELIEFQVDDGRFFDPIATPGDWHETFSMRFVHSQDPIGSGGMDDRYDQILWSSGLIDGAGLDYIGNSAIPFSTTTWNDPNHSYRTWGNDGTSFNGALTTVGNSMVGQAIAQALRDSANGSGHLPVFVDLRVPPEIDPPLTLDFGMVPQGSVAGETLMIENTGDVARWSVNGIEQLEYSFQAGPGVTVPPGTFIDQPGGGGNGHVIEIDTSTVGPFNGLLAVDSNSVDDPQRLVMVTGEIVPAGGCPEDLDTSGDVGFSDVLMLLAEWGPCVACPEDLNNSGGVGFDDILILLGAWGPCP